MRIIHPLGNWISSQNFILTFSTRKHKIAEAEMFGRGSVLESPKMIETITDWSNKLAVGEVTAI